MKWKKWQIILLGTIGLFAFGAAIAGTVHAAEDKPSKATERSPAVE